MLLLSNGPKWFGTTVGSHPLLTSDVHMPS